MATGSRSSAFPRLAGAFALVLATGSWAAARAPGLDGTDGRTGGTPAATSTPDAPGAAAFGSQGASAQPEPVPQHTGFKALFKDVIDDFKHLPSKDSAIVLSVGGMAALALHPVDEQFNHRLENSSAADAFFAAGKYLGYGAVQIGGAVATWAIGRAIDKRGRVVHLGLDLLRAQIVTQTLTYGVKVAVQRERPDGSGYSFPSGHASTTFASAAVLERHLGLKWAFPTYAVATYVAMSRLQDNRHFISDVVFGGAIGLMSGRTVVARHGRNNFALVPYATPGGMGIALTRVGP